MKKNLLLYLFLFILSHNSYSTVVNQVIRGVVFEDQNANGELDKNEKPLKNILISNGLDITKTNKRGEYQIKQQGVNTIFVILPSGFTSSTPNRWYKKVDAESSTLNFGLKKFKTDDEFSIMAIGDVQVGSQRELEYAGYSLGEALVNKNKNDFGIFLGDMVNDTIGLFTPLKEFLNLSKMPYKSVYGNHDRNLQRKENNQQTDFENIFGPTTYAFFYGQVLFISLNTIKPVGKYGYEGFYNKKELEFLQNVLKHSSNDQLIVINQHIPLAWIKNKEDVLKLLQIENEILVLSGHTHSISRRYYQREGFSDIQELTAGAVSGNWWTGQKNWKGVPLSLMKCGSPRGYFEIDFNKNKYQFKFKPLGLPETEQMSVWIGDLDQDALPLTIDDRNTNLILNFFSGSDNTKINYYLNGMYCGTLKKKKIVDPYVSRIKRLQSKNLMPDSLSKPAPYLNSKSSHIWGTALPYDQLQYTNSIRFEITDPSLETINQEFIFWKVNPH